MFFLLLFLEFVLKKCRFFLVFIFYRIKLFKNLDLSYFRIVDV